VKVLFTGLPLFAGRTARLLASRSEGPDRFLALDTSTRTGQLRFLKELPAADTVFCHWGTLWRARVLELALALHKRVVQYWVGTDVLFAADAVRSGTAIRRYADRCRHVCEAPWTRDELTEVGIRADVVPVAPMSSVAPEDEATRDPTELSVLGYVGPRHDFYRLDRFVRLAGDFPELRFRIAGTEGAAGPANLEFVGWTDDPSELYRDCAVFVRIPEHDGYSSSAREALAWGRHVIASYPYPHCRHVTDYGSLRDELASLVADFEAGRLRANRAGRAFVLDEFGDEKVALGLRRVLAGDP
jgi:hypothetical protein